MSPYRVLYRTLRTKQKCGRTFFSGTARMTAVLNGNTLQTRTDLVIGYARLARHLYEVAGWLRGSTAEVPGVEDARKCLTEAEAQYAALIADWGSANAQSISPESYDRRAIAEIMISELRRIDPIARNASTAAQ